MLIGSSTGFLASGFIMAGTLGCFVRSGSSSALNILSNNHVLADENRYPKGSSIIQPGGLDGGSPTADRVAKLTRLRAAALLFAGGDHGGSNGKGLTYANPIAAVLEALKVKLA